MEKNGQDDNVEFTFVKEKIKPKWKKRIRRVVIGVVSTLLLALLFGVVARFVFIKSESMLYSLLGIDPTNQDPQRGQISFTSPAPEDLTTMPTASPTARPTSVNTPTPTPVPATPTQEPDMPEVTKEPEPVEEDALTSYVQLMKELRVVANEASKSIMTVTTVTTGVNWLDEGIEITEELPGIVMGENNVELLMLVEYDKVRAVDRIEIRLSSQLVLEAVLYNYDSEYNIAVLAVPLEQIPERVLDSIKPIELGESAMLYEGMPIIAIGSPNGYNGSVEYGFVTAKGSLSYMVDGRVELFYTDITDCDSSSGIIIDLDGRLVGVITQAVKSQNEINANTAIGISSIKKLILSLLNNTDRVYFGIRAEDIPADVLERMELTNGIYVNEVIDGSPAFAAGLRKGDVISAVGITAAEALTSPAPEEDESDQEADEEADITVRSVSGFVTVLEGCNVSDVLTVQVYRSSIEEKEITFNVTLAKKEN